MNDNSELLLDVIFQLCKITIIFDSILITDQHVAAVLSTSHKYTLKKHGMMYRHCRKFIAISQKCSYIYTYPFYNPLDFVRDYPGEPVPERQSQFGFY